MPIFGSNEERLRANQERLRANQERLNANRARPRSNQPTPEQDRQHQAVLQTLPRNNTSGPATGPAPAAPQANLPANYNPPQQPPLAQMVPENVGPMQVHPSSQHLGLTSQMRDRPHQVRIYEGGLGRDGSELPMPPGVQPQSTTRFGNVEEIRYANPFGTPANVPGPGGFVQPQQPPSFDQFLNQHLGRLAPNSSSTIMTPQGLMPNPAWASILTNATNTLSGAYNNLLDHNIAQRSANRSDRGMNLQEAAQLGHNGIPGSMQLAAREADRQDMDLVNRMALTVRQMSPDMQGLYEKMIENGIAPEEAASRLGRVQSNNPESPEQAEARRWVVDMANLARSRAQRGGTPSGQSPAPQPAQAVPSSGGGGGQTSQTARGGSVTPANGGQSSPSSVPVYTDIQHVLDQVAGVTRQGQSPNLKPNIGIGEFVRRLRVSRPGFVEGNLDKIRAYAISHWGQQAWDEASRGLFPATGLMQSSNSWVNYVPVLNELATMYENPRSDEHLGRNDLYNLLQQRGQAPQHALPPLLSLGRLRYNIDNLMGVENRSGLPQQ